MLKIHSIIHDSYVDGPGRRSVVFFQGCPLACPGCQSRHLWPTTGGRRVGAKTLAAELMAGAKETQQRPDPLITISGGEPFTQYVGLAALVAHLRRLGFGVSAQSNGAGHIIVYSGFTWDQLQAIPGALGGGALADIDVLVEGRYIAAQDSPGMQYRGSANQRVIDVQATRRQGKLVLLDWDKPEIIITHDGRVMGSGPVIDFLAGLGMGETRAARRCGESGESGG